MAYIAAADLRERTQKHYAANLILGEADGTDAYIDSVIARVSTQVELDLGDDFEPPNPDSDETLDVDGYGTSRLGIPRRVRSLTTVSTRWPWASSFTAEASTSYRLRKSLNTANTAMHDGRKHDWLDAMTGLSTGGWPMGTETVRLVGKFGWAAVPEDIKRLVALRTYQLIKSSSDPLSTLIQLTTVDAVRTFGPPQEMVDIVNRYRRAPALAYVG